MELTHSGMIGDKITLVSATYGFIATFTLFLQVNYLDQLPDTTLAGLALLLAGFGGVLSYYSEKRENAEAKLRANISFAIGIGMIVGLLSYQKLVVESQSAAWWLALILGCGYANQGLFKVLRIGSRKKAMELLHITEADMGDSQNGRTGKNEVVSK
jgi:hypothetical protein